MAFSAQDCLPYTPLSSPEAQTMNETFEKQGYVVIPNVLNRERCEALRDFLLAIYRQRQADGTCLYPGKARDVLFDCHVRYPELIDTICNPVLVPVLKALLGDDFILTPDSSVLINRWNKLHTDTTGNELYGWNFHQELGFRMITTAIYLQDSDTAGGLRVVPGSHLEPDPCVENERREVELKRSRLKRFIKKLSGGRLYQTRSNFPQIEARAVDVPSKAGDAILFDVRLIHCSTPMPDCTTTDRLAIFGRAARNNQPTRTYIQYLHSVADAGYDFIHQPRDTQRFLEECSRYGFSTV